MKLLAYAKQHGIRYHTVWCTWQRGELPAHLQPTCAVLVHMLPSSPAIRHLLAAVYARVPSAENWTNLEGHVQRMAAICAARGRQEANVVKHCASGVADQRPQFLALLTDASIGHIAVEHKHRSQRLGVAYIQTLLKTQGRKSVNLDEAERGRKDLMQDVGTIITSSYARLYGRGQASQKKPHLLATMEAN